MNRFVVLAYPRTGSTLLVTSLAQNPRLAVYDELFAPSESNRREHAIEGRWYRDGDDAARFLREVVYAPGLHPGAEGIGFKLMNYDLKDPAGRDGWRWLAEDRELKVISLIRRDLLGTLISGKVGERLQRWHRPTGAPDDERVPPFRIEIAECRAHFAATAARSLEAAATFSGHPMLVVDYDRDLVDDFTATMERLWRFLGVAPAPVTQRLRKLATVPAREQVSNYDELKATFADTVWAFAVP